MNLYKISNADTVDANKIVLNIDKVIVTIEHPTNVTECDAVAIAHEMIDEEYQERSAPEYSGAE